jgi:mediator of RNA polymerase II transcription subunit 18
MTSLSYEVALFGEFLPQDLKAILNRITLHSESSQHFQSREIVFEPLDAQAHRELGADPVLLRARKEIADSDSSWSVLAHIPEFTC